MNSSYAREVSISAAAAIDRSSGHEPESGSRRRRKRQATIAAAPSDSAGSQLMPISS